MRVHQDVHRFHFWYGGDFYGGKIYTNYSSDCVTPPPTNHTFESGKESGGFFDGVFHEGYFYSIYNGGQWVNGWFHDKDYNWTSQIIPISIKYNYYINTIGSNYNLE